MLIRIIHLKEKLFIWKIKEAKAREEIKIKILSKTLFNNNNYIPRKNKQIGGLCK